jgi:hypothetical protein
VVAEVGAQRPRIESTPEASDLSIGDEAVELAASAGLELDDWEAHVLRHSFARQPDGEWAAFRIGLIVPRQNGKGAVLEARELANLFILARRLTIHSAHQFDTSLEAFRRLLFLIEDTPELEQQVKRVSRSHGEEGIELKGGERIRFRTRTKGGGRGFSCDDLILDEAMILPESSHGAILPTLSARPYAQVVYTGSAVDQAVHDEGIVLARVREQGIRGDDPRLAFFEWSIDADDPTDVTDEMAADPELWAQANPALWIRIDPDYIAAERQALAPRTFAVERLGVGDWPSTEGASRDGIDPEVWDALADPASKVTNRVCFVFDVRPDRAWSSIAVAGKRTDTLGHVEVVDRRKGTGWVVNRLVDLAGRHSDAEFVCAGNSPAASLLPACKDAGLTVEVIGPQEHAQACGLFFDTVDQGGLRHLGTPELAAAIRGAAKRPLGDAWLWSRKSSAVDITPLVASTLAFWKASNYVAEPLIGFAG